MKLDDLKELESKATPGPWIGDGMDGDESVGVDDTPSIFIKLDEAKAGPNAISVLFNADRGTEHDAALTVALRNLAPHFIAHMEAAKMLGVKFNVCQATYTPGGDETDATAEASEAIHEAFMKMAEAQNAFAAAIRAL